MEEAKRRTVCIYGAASDAIDPAYLEAVEDLARKLARRGFDMVYGGGSTGSMGAAARGFSAEGAHITGVVAASVLQFENTFDAMERIECDDLAIRKRIMEDRADAIIVVPGGVGTLDELFNALARIAVDELVKPLVIFNVNGFFDTLLAFLHELVDGGFLNAKRIDLLSVFDDADKLADWLETA